MGLMRDLNKIFDIFQGVPYFNLVNIAIPKVGF